MRFKYSYGRVRQQNVFWGPVFQGQTHADISYPITETDHNFLRSLEFYDRKKKGMHSFEPKGPKTKLTFCELRRHPKQLPRLILTAHRSNAQLFEMQHTATHTLTPQAQKTGQSGEFRQS